MRRALIAIVALLALAAGVWLGWPLPEPADLSPTTTPVTAPAETSHDLLPALAPYDPTGSPRPLQPLPALAELAARADQGDPIAACQLAAEFHDCGSAGWLDGKPRLSEEILAQQAEALANQPAERQSAIMVPMRARFRCQQLGETYRDRHFDWLRQAAMAGEPEAVFRYAVGEAFGYSYGGDFSLLRSPRFEVWRREAPVLLEQLLQAGYPDVLAPLLFSSDPMLGGHVGALLPADPVRERAYLHLAALMSGNTPEMQQMRAWIASLKSDVDNEAYALAREWHLQYFQGRTLESTVEGAGHRVARMHAAGQSCSQRAPGIKP